MLVGCAPNQRSGGVEAVGSQQLDASPVAGTVLVTLPGAGARTDTGGAGAADTRRVGAEREVTVETLVEPVVARPATVAVVGDSLTQSAEDEILASLTAAGLDVVTVDGLESRRMTVGGSSLPPGTKAIESIRQRTEPGVWVIALGTNDVASMGSANGFRTEMREVLALLPTDVPVVWVDLWIRDRESSITEANEFIRQELRTWRGGAAVVDWFSHGEDDGIITSDGIHLTGPGQQLFADSIAAAIDELFAP